ncbi:MAG TPA: PQQ-binding-like beta-propeller repeat protein [Patescibacteria group bacterium]|nr:PQQ-binding-like beta-propeller repeat protein [Patescibacteria group bacterium]
MKTPPRHALSRLAACTLALLLLTSCAQVKQMFSDDDTAPPLKGERISILQLQKELAPNPALEGQAVTLPDAWTNQFWPQRGGYPNHALGHLALGPKLARAWKSSIGRGADKRTPLTALPIVAENSVYALDTKGELSSFALADGKRQWHKSLLPKKEEDTGAVGGGLAYASGRLFATTGYKFVQALNPKDGAQLWRASLPAPARSAPTVMDERVYVVTLDNRLSVFSAKDGSPLWEYAGVSETTNLLGSASPAADASLVVLPLSSGEIFGLRPENGQVAWEDNLSSVRRSGSLNSISDIKGLPVIDQGVVYAVSFSGRLVALDQVSGSRIWQREIGSADTPWPAGDTVFVLTADQQLVAMTRAEGDVRWVTALPRFEEDDRDEPLVWTGPVLAGGRLIVVSSAGTMAEINPQDGKIISRADLDAGATLPPIVASNTLIVLTQDGVLRAYR